MIRSILEVAYPRTATGRTGFALFLLRAYNLNANVVALLAGPGSWSVDALLLKRTAGRAR